MNEDTEVQIARVKLSLGQVVVIVTVIVAMGVSWGVVQSTLQANREVMLRVESSVRTMDDQLTVIRNHQIYNEALIDRHTEDIESIKRKLGMPSRNMSAPRSLDGPKR